MKVALLLTGHLRTYRSTASNFLNNIIFPYDCDVFCVTWNRHETGEPVNKHFSSIYENHVKGELLKDYAEYMFQYPRIQKNNRINDVFDLNARAKEHGLYWGNRLRDQWFLIKSAYQMIKNPYDYDVIFRIRYDAHIHSKIDFVKNESINIPKDIGGWNFTDHMAYGVPCVMSKYCNLFDHIESLYLNDNVDISHAVDMPKYYMTEKEPRYLINIDANIHYHILK
jgi:hypothetical protein